MARKPKDTKEVFHYWAHRVMPEAKCGNVRYNGDVLFSYAEPIARLFPTFVLVSDRQFSATTHMHQSKARQATHNLKTVTARYIPEYSDPRSTHAHNKDFWEERATDAAAKLINFPRRKVSINREQAVIASQYKTYSDAFELNWPDLDVGLLAEERAKLAVQRAQEKKEAEELRIRVQANNLALWRKHEFTGYFQQTALRLSRNRDEIETSRGAVVPVSAAQNLWAVANKCRHNCLNYCPTNGEWRVGHYRLDRVDNEGNLYIGCHTIPYSELVLMAEQLGFIKQEIAA